MTVAQELIRKETAKAKARKDRATEESGRRTLENQLARLGMSAPKWDWPFRPWVFDGTYPELWVAIEVEGRGRHMQTYGRKRKDGTRGTPGYERDCEKYNAATLAGWRVLRFTYPMIRDGRAAKTIADALAYATQDPR